VETTSYSEKAMAVWESGPSPESYRISEAESVVLVAEVESEIAGFAEASFETPELDKLYVRPAYQRRGVAGALLDAIERRVRERGVKSLSVEASLNAVPFYEQAGFRCVGTHEKTVTVDTESVEMPMAELEKNRR
jgi:putative acetyltransferase